MNISFSPYLQSAPRLYPGAGRVCRGGAGRAAWWRGGSGPTQPRPAQSGGGVGPGNTAASRVQTTPALAILWGCENGQTSWKIVTKDC